MVELLRGDSVVTSCAKIFRVGMLNLYSTSGSRIGWMTVGDVVVAIGIRYEDF